MRASAFSVLAIFFSTWASHIAIGQNAYYHFDNADFNDYIGSYDATIVNDVSYSGGADKYATLKDTTGYVTLPAGLTQILLSQNSLEIAFLIRFTAGQPTCVMTAQDPISTTFWENPGFTIFTTIGPTGELVFSYADGTSNGSANFPDLALDTWHSVKLTLNLNSNYWLFSVNDQLKTGQFTAGFDAQAFKNAVQGGIFTIGGFGGMKPFPWYGKIDLNELKITFPATSTNNQVRSAFHALYQDLDGSMTLTDNEKAALFDAVRSGLPLADFDQIRDSLFAYTQQYEALNPPLFESYYSHFVEETNLPLHDQIVLYAQAFVFESRFTPENIDGMAGIRYEFGELFPGQVDGNAPRVTGATAEINGTYHTDIAAEYGMQDFVVRPTGYYLAAGDIATIQVPNGYAGQGLSVVVGAHFRNMPEGGTNRPRDISCEYPITSNLTKIANPYGGGIYIKVPDGTNLGWFEITVSNAIRSPYFSWRENRKTPVSEWLTAIQNTNAPWADFESDKYMFTIPTSFAAMTDQPDHIMMRWDSIMDAFRIAGGRPVDTRIRAEYYLIDRKLVTPAYGSGYPTVGTMFEFDRPDSDWNPLTVFTLPPHATLMHEMGHTAMHPTMQYDSAHACEFEAETIVHLPMALINEYVYGMPPDEAFSKSGVFPYSSGFDGAAFDWIITHNFRNNLPMSYDPTAPMPDKDQLKYQHRGWAKYLDIARIFSWDILSDIFGRYYIPGVAQNSTVTCNPDFQNIAGRNEFIRYACEVTGENLTPLFHFWGINPADTLAASMSALPKSQRVKALIDHYQCVVAPQSFADYQYWHNQLYVSIGYQQPRYDQYLATFDQSYVDAINGQFEHIRNVYGLYGPAAPSNLMSSATGNQVQLQWTDNSADETGFVIRFRESTSNPFLILATVGANETSYTSAVLDPGSYDFMVTAINQDQLESNHCDADTTTVDIICGGPTAVCQNVTVYLDAGGQAAITAALIGGASTAPCGMQADSLSRLTFSCQDLDQPVTVTYWLTDMNGGRDSCTATVTVTATVDTVIQSDIVPDTTLQAPLQLVTDGTVVIGAGDSVTFVAGSVIRLLPGFRAAGPFSARIEACAPAAANAPVQVEPETETAEASARKGTAPWPEETPPVLGLQCYPNPAAVTTRAILQLPGDGPASLHLYDLYGRTVERILDQSALPRGNHDLDLDLHRLPPGIYILRLQQGRETVSRRLVVNR